MSQAEKRLAAMRANPLGDWRIDDVEMVCRAYDITVDPPRGSSHYVVKRASLRERLSIPARRPIKAVYVRHLVAFIDAVRSR